MRRVNKGTPNSLIVKVVEICVLRELANQINTNLRFIVRKGAIFPIVTQASRTCVALAKFRFVLIRMVEFFNSRMAINAAVTSWTLFFLSYVSAQLTRVRRGWSAPIFDNFVIFFALFEIVIWIVTLFAFQCFESFQI